MLNAGEMLRPKHKRGYAYDAVAVCLALFFSFSSLAPLAPQSLSSPSASMHCCRTKGKSCCCHKNSNQDPAISGRSCPNDCGHITLGSVAGIDYVPLRSAAWATVVDASGQALVPTHYKHTRLLTHELLQRPPRLL